MSGVVDIGSCLWGSLLFAHICVIKKLTEVASEEQGEEDSPVRKISSR